MTFLSSLASYFSLEKKQNPPLVGLLEISLLRIQETQTVTVEYNAVQTTLGKSHLETTYDIFNPEEPVKINGKSFPAKNRTEEVENATVQIKITKSKVKISPEDFTRIKLVGKGSSKVYLARYNRTNRNYACKVFKKSKDQKNPINEKNLLIRLKDSPFLIKLLLTFQSPTELFLVFPYYKYDLFTLLQTTLPEATVRIYFCELLLAINHFHSRNVIYRDIKPENILIDSNNHILLCDLDLSVDSAEPTNYYGTLEYIPPEIVRNERYDESYDYYTLGILLYEMVVGHTPYRTEGTGKEEEDIKNRILYEEIEFPNTVNKKIKDLIIKLTDKIGSRRIRYKEILEHKWIEGIDWNKIHKKEYKIEIKIEEKETEIEESIEEDSYRTAVQGFTWIGEDWEEE